jgi:hypothetical protein
MGIEEGTIKNPQIKKWLIKKQRYKIIRMTEIPISFLFRF